MKKRVALNFKLFFKSPLLVLGFAAAMVIPHVMMWERTGLIFANSDDYVYGLINYMLLYGAVPFLLTAFLTYEFVKKSKDAGLWESFESLKATRKVLMSQLPVIAAVMLAVYGMYLSYGVAAAVHYAHQTAVVWQNLIGAAVLYFLLPGCVAVAMGILFALKAARPVAYGVFVGWSVVMSHMVGDKIGVVSPKIVFQVRQFLNICNSNERWINTLYGIMTEGYRYSLVLFWLMLFVCGIIWVLTDQSGRKWIYRAVPMALCVLCGVGWFGKVGYITNDGSATTGTGRMMSNIYMFYSHENGGYPKNQKADFTVTQMDLRLDIDNQLKGQATLHLDDIDNQNKLLFTLQHSYRIHSITDQNGNALPYTRTDLDFITVDISGSNNIQSVTFVYSGVNGQHFAKKQGIMLPGNISYYPVEGWVSSFYSQTGLSPFEQIKPVLFTERTINLTLYTNTDGVVVSLPQTGENTYSGVTDGVSIMGGYTTTKSVANTGMTATYPFLLEYFYTKNADSFVTRMKEIDTLLGTDYMTMLQNTPIFVYDYSEFGVFDDQLSAIVFDDHIVMKDVFADYAAAAVPAACVVNDPQKAAVGKILYWYLRDEYERNNLLNAYGLQKGYMDIYADIDHIAPTFVQAIGYDARTREVDPEKEAAVLKAMGAYLTDESDTRTAEELMQSLL